MVRGTARIASPPDLSWATGALGIECTSYNESIYCNLYMLLGVNSIPLEYSSHSTHQFLAHNPPSFLISLTSELHSTFYAYPWKHLFCSFIHSKIFIRCLQALLSSEQDRIPDLKKHTFYGSKQKMKHMLFQMEINSRKLHKAEKWEERRAESEELLFYQDVLFKIWARTRKKWGRQGFPGGAVVKNLPANAGDTGSRPGQQLSLCATTTEPAL